MLINYNGSRLMTRTGKGSWWSFGQSKLVSSAIRVESFDAWNHSWVSKMGGSANRDGPNMLFLLGAGKSWMDTSVLLGRTPLCIVISLFCNGSYFQRFVF